jgi:hypothetical protein
MKTLNIILVIILIVLASFYMLTNRYKVVGVSDRICYRLDKWTGKMWFVYANKMLEVEAKTTKDKINPGSFKPLD